MTFLGHVVSTFAQPDLFVNHAFHIGQVFPTLPHDRMAADGKAVELRAEAFGVAMLGETGLGASVLRFLAWHQSSAFDLAKRIRFFNDRNNGLRV